MCGCVRHGMKPRRCKGRCRMMDWCSFGGARIKKMRPLSPLSSTPTDALARAVQPVLLILSGSIGWNDLPVSNLNLGSVYGVLVMRNSSWTPSIVPCGNGQNVYLVADDFSANARTASSPSSSRRAFCRGRRRWKLELRGRKPLSQNGAARNCCSPSCYDGNLVYGIGGTTAARLAGADRA
jgi:hypothetical protein